MSVSTNRPSLRRIFTDEDVFNLFRGVLDVVKRLDPPDDLRVECFRSVAVMFGQATEEADVPPAVHPVPAALLRDLR